MNTTNLLELRDEVPLFIEFIDTETLVSVSTHFVDKVKFDPMSREMTDCSKIFLQNENIEHENGAPLSVPVARKHLRNW